MIMHLLKGVLSGIAVKVVEDYRYLTIQLLKIEAAKSYLHGVKMARRSAIGLMRMGIEIGLICVGAVLLHGGLFILLPWTVKAKAVLGMFLGLAYMVIGGVALCESVDEEKWMQKSGAAEMMKEAISQTKKD